MAVQDTFTTLAKGSCLALCLAKLVEPVGTRDGQLMMDVILGWRKSYIADDGWVSGPEDFLMLIDTYHRKWTYKKVEIKSLKDIPYGLTVPVFYSINGKEGHFVLANNNGIVWNPLSVSKNVNEGKPISYREVKHSN